MGGEGGQMQMRSHLDRNPSGQSRFEMGDKDGHVWTDPATAHNGVGDTGYTLRLPETCALCAAEAMAEKEAKAP